MDINLNFYVNQGRYGITNNTNLNFGTDGLGTCVGIIVQLNNGTNFCGHMDHSYEPTRAQQVAFMAAVTAVLTATIPMANVTSVHYCTPGGTFAAAFTVLAIQALFPAAINAGNNSCIYIDGTGVHGTDQHAIQGVVVDTGAFRV